MTGGLYGADIQVDTIYESWLSMLIIELPIEGPHDFTNLASQAV